MNKVFLVLLFSILYSSSFAQMINSNEIEQQNHLDNMSWTDKAIELSNNYKPNNNGELALSVVKEYKNIDKSELYKRVLNWVLSIAPSDNNLSIFSDKDIGLIQTRCHITNIAKRTTLDNSYIVHLSPLLKFEFKEEKVRFTFSLKSFEVSKNHNDIGYVMMMNGDFGIVGGLDTKDYQTWPLIECYPFAQKPKHPKITSSRALVNTIACYNILVDKIDTAIRDYHPAENEDW